MLAIACRYSDSRKCLTKLNFNPAVLFSFQVSLLDIRRDFSMKVKLRY